MNDIIITIKHQSEKPACYSIEVESKGSDDSPLGYWQKNVAAYTWALPNALEIIGAEISNNTITSERMRELNYVPF